VGVPVVGALAVVVGVPVTGLTLEDLGVTVGVPVVGATELGGNVGPPVAGDTKGLPFQDSLWVFLWWEHWQWWWGFQPQG
jgi:hypothetical protein